MTNTKTMTGAMLKVQLEGLGLPPSWFGDRLNVTMRTVVRWFDGGDVTSTVAREVDALADLTLKEMLKMIEEADAGALDEPKVLKTFRTDKEFAAKRGRSKIDWPASWHRSLTFRVYEHLKAQGNEVTVEYR